MIVIRVASSAATQIEEAAAWWATNRSAAADLFGDELARAYMLMRTLPDAGQQVTRARRRSVRRLLLGRTGYHIYYTYSGDAVEVIALWHSARGTGPDV